MKYSPIDNSLFIQNRKKFIKHLDPKSLAIFNSNDIYPISADSAFEFEQHRDIFHLSGADQEETVLLIFPDSFHKKHREVLFVRETNEHIAIWEGEKLTKQKATQVSGISTIYWLQDLPKLLNELMAEADTVYINTNEHLRADTSVQTREDRFIIDLKNKYPAHNYKKSAPIMHQIRAVKNQTELDLMQMACEITEKGFKRVLQFTKPGVAEYEIEAEYLHEFVRNRSKGFAYIPIIASGNNANVLHYIENNQICKDGDLLLMDVAAEYANYKADMTRTIPVNGKFTARQKEVYTAVNHVKKEATKLLTPGTYLHEYHKEVGSLMEEQLLKLKLIDKADVQNQDPDWPAYKKYFMHGTSHYIGLDTHDLGLWTAPMEANMVFTVEPGIYIPAEGFGIRLEDDVVVQDKGEPINLMKNIPIEADDIEDWMNSKK